MSAIYSCVVDAKPKFQAQALIWVWTAIEFAKIVPNDLVVHMIEPANDPLANYLKWLGVQIVLCQPWDNEHPYCNKLIQLNTAQLSDAAHVVLSDCDMAFAAPFDDRIWTSQIRGRIVDRPFPSLKIWQDLFKLAELNREPKAMEVGFSEDLTYINNCNGGLYIIPQAHWKPLTQAWPRWAKWSFNHEALLGDYATFHDQIAFALSCEELGIDVLHLPPAYNYPTHLGDRLRDLDHEPVAIHYHDRFDLNDGLHKTGLVNVDRALDRVNTYIQSMPAAAKELITVNIKND